MIERRPDNGRWLYVVKAEYQDCRCTVTEFGTKREAKDLRNHLRERFGRNGAKFYLVWDAPRPRWAQIKRALINSSEQEGEG